MLYICCDVECVWKEEDYPKFFSLNLAIVIGIWKVYNI